MSAFLRRFFGPPFFELDENKTRSSETDRSFAIEIAGQFGLALENARILDEAQRRAAQE